MHIRITHVIPVCYRLHNKKIFVPVSNTETNFKNCTLHTFLIDWLKKSLFLSAGLRVRQSYLVLLPQMGLTSWWQVIMEHWWKDN